MWSVPVKPMLSGGIGLCTLCVSAILVTLLMAGCGNGALIDEPEKLYTTLQRLTFGTVSEPQLTWSDVIFDTLRGQVHNVSFDSLPQVTSMRSTIEASQFLGSFTIVFFGYLLHKVLKLSLSMVFMYLPLLFIALEVLAQIGIIGASKEGIVDWIRASNVTATIEDEFLKDLPSPADVKPLVETCLWFLVSEGALVSVGFVLAFIV